MTRRAVLSELPFWPRYLSREEAARYVGVGPAVWDAEVKAGLWPKPRLRGGRGGRLTWDRLLIDAAADQASGLAQQQGSAPPGPPGQSVDDLLDQRHGKTT